MRILVVDDDPAISEMLSILLESEGYTPVTCDTGDGALALFRAHHPSLVLLDLMLPGIDGVEVCRQIRRLSDVPVIMLTARTDTEDVVAGLEAGADDYVTKPFQTTELLARVRARLRHLSTAVTPEVLRAGDLDIDVAAHRVLRGAQTIAVTPLEFDLLTTLARSPWKASPARSSWTRCGATSTARTPAWSTSTSSACAPRWSRTRSAPASW